MLGSKVLLHARSFFHVSSRRLMSTDVSGGKLVYTGGYEKILTILKRVSVFSCICTLVGVPLLAVSSENPRMKGIHKWAVAFVVSVFGLGTTAALFVVTKPYVVRMFHHPQTNLLSMETLNAFGKIKTSHLHFDNVVSSTKPWASFESKTNPSQRYFVESTRDSYLDEEFYRLMVSRANLIPEQAKKSSSF